MDMKIVAKIAIIAGLAFAAFSILSAAVAYNVLTSTTSCFVHLSTIRLTVWSAMLPYLLVSVVSFTIAIFASRFRSVLKQEQFPVSPETQGESDPSKTLI